MIRYHKPGVVLASGGIDSTTLMYSLQSQGLIDSVFFVDYGQASAPTQQRFLEYHCSKLGLHLWTDKVVWPAYAMGHGYIFKNESYPSHVVKDPYEVLKMNNEQYETWKTDVFDFIEGRNLEFFNRVCMWARHRDVDTVYTGMQFDEPEWALRPSGDFENDCSALFLENFNRLSRLGAYSKPVNVLAPFLEAKLSKRQIIQLARGLCVPLTATHSCEFFPACTRCRPCLIRGELLPVVPKKHA